MAKHPPDDLSNARSLIGEKVRELRTSRQWSQRELAARLGLSQNRLSEIERGGGSFSAEQFLLILRLFNVDVGAFDPARAPAEGALQNALIRFGADHLRQVRDAPISDRYRNASAAITAVLLDPFSERFLTALAPVVVRSCEDVALSALQAELAGAGRPNRLGWLAENTFEAIETLAAEGGHPRWKKAARRAQLVLGEFLVHLHPTTDPAARDALDRGIRTAKTLDRTWERGSAISRKWQIVSALQVEDFVDALRRAREPN